MQICIVLLERLNSEHCLLRRSFPLLWLCACGHCALGVAQGYTLSSTGSLLMYAKSGSPSHYTVVCTYSDCVASLRDVNVCLPEYTGRHAKCCKWFCVCFVCEFRFGFSTTALEAIIEDATEKYQALLLDERLREMRAELKRDNFEQVKHCSRNLIY